VIIKTCPSRAKEAGTMAEPVSEKGAGALSVEKGWPTWEERIKIHAEAVRALFGHVQLTTLGDVLFTRDSLGCPTCLNLLLHDFVGNGCSVNFFSLQGIFRSHSIQGGHELDRVIVGLTREGEWIAVEVRIEVQGPRLCGKSVKLQSGLKEIAAHGVTPKQLIEMLHDAVKDWQTITVEQLLTIKAVERDFGATWLIQGVISPP
jgi:hypothetical protein